MPSPKVYISILNWNGISDTVPCIESILKSDYDNYHIIVVDNASSDNSVSVIREKFPTITLLENTTNAGFTGGNNIAIKHALENGADYIWLLNNDTEIDSSTISGIIRLAERDSSIGMVSPVISYYEDKSRIQFCGASIDPSTMAMTFFTDTYLEKNEIIASDIFLWGTALLIKADLLQRIGGLDDSLFMYWEDTEFSLRVIKAGYLGAICCTERVYHKTPIHDFGKRGQHYYYYMIRNAILVAKRCLSSHERRVFTKRKVSNFVFTIADLVSSGQRECAHSSLMGIMHGLSGRTGKMCVFKENTLRTLVVWFVAKFPYFCFNLINSEYKTIFRQVRRKLVTSVQR